VPQRESKVEPFSYGSFVDGWRAIVNLQAHATNAAVFACATLRGRAKSLK